MRPIVAQVAADEPDTAANIAQPTTFTCRSRPGSRCIHGARPANKSSASFVRNKISPIQINIGSAIRSQPFSDCHSEVESEAPVGAADRIFIATKPIAPSASAIQTPEPSTMKSRRTRKIVHSTKPIPYSCPCVIALSALTKEGAPFVQVNTSSSSSATQSVARPSVIALCGIQYLIGNRPDETSPNFQEK
jgi:hypothetical protein